MNSSRKLQPGVDYSLWPQLKWTRARQLNSAFDSSVELYSTSVSKGLRATIAADGLSVVFAACVPHAAPTYEWSLIVADALHNYRTALDGLAWELAHLDGAAPPPSQAKRIYFPICTSRSQWQAQAKGPLATIPAEFLGRLNSLQPYHVEPVQEGIFVMLHELDIADKHKAQVQTTLVPREINQYHYRLTHDPEVNQDDVATNLEWIAGEHAVKDGDAIFRITASSPIRTAECDMALPLQVSIKHRNRTFNVYQILEMIDAQVGATFELIETGGLSSDPDGRPLATDE